MVFYIVLFYLSEYYNIRISECKIDKDFFKYVKSRYFEFGISKNGEEKASKVLTSDEINDCDSLIKKFSDFPLEMQKTDSPLSFDLFYEDKNRFRDYHKLVTNHSSFSFGLDDRSAGSIEILKLKSAFSLGFMSLRLVFALSKIAGKGLIERLNGSGGVLQVPMDGRHYSAVAVNRDTVMPIKAFFCDLESNKKDDNGCYEDVYNALPMGRYDLKVYDLRADEYKKNGCDYNRLQVNIESGKVLLTDFVFNTVLHVQTKEDVSRSAVVNIDNNKKLRIKISRDGTSILCKKDQGEAEYEFLAEDISKISLGDPMVIRSDAKFNATVSFTPKGNAAFAVSPIIPEEYFKDAFIAERIYTNATSDTEYFIQQNKDVESRAEYVIIDTTLNTTSCLSASSLCFSFNEISPVSFFDADNNPIEYGVIDGEFCTVVRERIVVVATKSTVFGSSSIKFKCMDRKTEGGVVLPTMTPPPGNGFVCYLSNDKKSMKRLMVISIAIAIIIIAIIITSILVTCRKRRKKKEREINDSYSV